MTPILGATFVMGALLPYWSCLTLTVNRDTREQFYLSETTP